MALASLRFCRNLPGLLLLGNAISTKAPCAGSFNSTFEPRHVSSNNAFAWADPDWRQGVRTPLEYHKNIRHLKILVRIP